MSTQVLDPTDAAHLRVLDHKVFEQELKLADALVLAEPRTDHYSPDVHQPSPPHCTRQVGRPFQVSTEMV